MSERSVGCQNPAAVTQRVSTRGSTFRYVSGSGYYNLSTVVGGATVLQARRFGHFSSRPCASCDAAYAGAYNAKIASTQQQALDIGTRILDWHFRGFMNAVNDYLGQVKAQNRQQLGDWLWDKAGDFIRRNGPCIVAWTGAIAAELVYAYAKYQTGGATSFIVRAVGAGGSITASAGWSNVISHAC